MRKIKGYITAATMLAVITFGTTFANAGIIVAGALETDPNPCTETEKDLGGIIVAGITEFSKFAITGIIVAGAFESETSNETCGIIVAG